MGDSYRVLSNHPENLSCGQMVAPGETSDRVDPQDPHDRRLIESGKLALVGEQGINATGPAVEKADELGVDLNEVSGTGSGGRITVEDVEAKADETEEDE